VTTVVGVGLRSRREALGLPQAVLARLLGVSQNVVSSWEQTTRTPRDPVGVHMRVAELEKVLEDLIAQIVLAQQAVQTRAVQPQQIRRRLLVPARPFQCRHNQHAFPSVSINPNAHDFRRFSWATFTAALNPSLPKKAGTSTTQMIRVGSSGGANGWCECRSGG